MTAYEARQILIQIKKQLRHRDVHQALDLASKALVLQEIEQQKSLFDDEEEESGEDRFEQQQ